MHHQKYITISAPGQCLSQELMYLLWHKSFLCNWDRCIMQCGATAGANEGATEGANEDATDGATEGGAFNRDVWYVKVSHLNLVYRHKA